MFINKEGKLFGKVSIIDVFVLLAIIILLIGIYLRVISPVQRIVTVPQQIEYEMRIHAVRHSTLIAIQNTIQQEPTNEIFDRRTGEELGTIVDMSFDQTRWDVALLDGTFDTLVVPDRFDAIITIRVDGRVSETGYLTHQNRELAVGSQFGLQSRYVDTSGEIIAIRRIDVDVEEGIEEENENGNESEGENDIYPEE